MNRGAFKLNRNIVKPAEDKVRTSHKWAWSLLSIFIGLMIGWLILLFTGHNPIDFFSQWAKGNFSSVTNFGNFMERFAWLLPLGLSVLVAFRIKIFNIGVSSQMMLGGIAGYFFAANADMGRAGVLFSILIPTLVGMLVAMFIGFLKTKFKINEVISSIMLNWSVFYLYKFFTNSNNFPEYFQGGSQMIPILPGNSLQGPPIGNTHFNWGFLIVIVILALIIFAYKFLPWGIKQDVLGSNQNAAKYAGINVNRNIIKTMAISGALAGLAGSIFYLGEKNNLPLVGTDIPGHTFTGITTSLIAFNNPVGIIFSTLFVASFENSRSSISTVVEPRMVDLIMAITVLCISISSFFIIYRPHEKIINWLDGKDLLKKKTNKNVKEDKKTKQNIFTKVKLKVVNKPKETDVEALYISNKSNKK